MSLKFRDNITEPNIPTNPILRDNRIGLLYDGKYTPKSTVTLTLVDPDISISKEFSSSFSKFIFGPNPAQISELTEGIIDIAQSIQGNNVIGKMNFFSFSSNNLKQNLSIKLQEFLLQFNPALESISISNAHFKITDTREMFYNCSKLTTLTFYPYSTKNIN